nr:Na+/H+ antiporter NhaA [Thalassotalea sp. PS06]
MATIIALWWANSDYAISYQQLIHQQIGFFIGEHYIQTTVKHIMNDGLMVIFFFMLGLEIKREFIAGELADPKSRKMLVACALGGMIFPALFYAGFNWSQDSIAGWGIPMATDTAFALGVLMLLRKHIPNGLLAFIVGLAIVDDIGALMVIALFYTEQLSLAYFAGAISGALLLLVANAAGVRQPIFYILIGLIIWFLMLKSGIHATLAGVLIALTIPARPQSNPEKVLTEAKDVIEDIQVDENNIDVLSNRSDHEKVTKIRVAADLASTPLRRWEDALELPVALLIVPLFALTNAGIPLNFDALQQSVSTPVGLGIIFGLVLGKFLGIGGACYLALRLRFGELPGNVQLTHVLGMSFIAGIGFTMSTFIATLAFEHQPETLTVAKMSIMTGSIVAAFLGATLLYVSAKFKGRQEDENRPVFDNI